MKRVALVLAALLVSATAHAAVAEKHLIQPPFDTGKVLLNNIALNGAAGVRTLTLSSAAGSLPAHGFAKLVLSVKRTRVAGTDLTMTCTQSPDGGTTDYALEECESAAASGTCEFYTQTWSDSAAASKNHTWSVDILGYTELECIFASTSAGATDKLTVTGQVVTQ